MNLQRKAQIGGQGNGCIRDRGIILSGEDHDTKPGAADGAYGSERVYEEKGVGKVWR